MNVLHKGISTIFRSAYQPETITADDLKFLIGNMKDTISNTAWGTSNNPYRMKDFYIKTLKKYEERLINGSHA